MGPDSCQIMLERLRIKKMIPVFGQILILKDFVNNSKC